MIDLLAQNGVEERRQNMKQCLSILYFNSFCEKWPWLLLSPSVMSNFLPNSASQNVSSLCILILMLVLLTLSITSQELI